MLPDGSRDMLGLRIEQTEGAKFWMKVFSNLKPRGCRDILIAVTDGLKGMSEAHSLDFANWKSARRWPRRSRTIYGAPSAEAAEQALDVFARGPLGQKFPMVVAS